jgi:hypothetical protein
MSDNPTNLAAGDPQLDADRMQTTPGPGFVRRDK